MGRIKTSDVLPCEPLKARITFTETGYPVDIATAREAYGQAVKHAPEPAWFWIFASPRSAADIRRRGLRAVGTLTTTWIPPQTAGAVAAVDESSVPIVGTQEHADLMIAETCEHEGRPLPEDVLRRMEAA